MKRKPFKTMKAWINIHPSGLPSCLFYFTDKDMKRSRCADRCSGEKPYWRYIKVRITKVKPR